MADKFDRREFGALVGLSSLAAIASPHGPANAEGASPATNPGASRPFHIGMIIYDGMTTLDFAGPADLFSRPPQAKVFVISKSSDPIVSDTQGRILVIVTPLTGVSFTDMARWLGVSRLTMREKLIQFGIHPAQEQGRF